MIVRRYTLTVKNRDGVLAWINSVRERFNASVVVRIYQPIEGAASNVIAWEEEHESIADAERHSSERKSHPDWDTLWNARYSEFFSDTHKEIWEMVDPE